MQKFHPFSKFRRHMRNKLSLFFDFANSRPPLKSNSYPLSRNGYVHGCTLWSSEGSGTRSYLNCNIAAFLVHIVTQILQGKLLLHNYANVFLYFFVCCLTKHDDVIKWKHFPCYWPLFEGNLLVTVGFTKASDAKHWCFLWSAPDQMIEQTIETPVIWDAIPLIVT